MTRDAGCVDDWPGEGGENTALAVKLGWSSSHPLRQARNSHTKEGYSHHLEKSIKKIQLTLSRARNVKNFGNSLCLEIKAVPLVSPEEAIWPTQEHPDEERTDDVTSYVFITKGAGKSSHPQESRRDSLNLSSLPVQHDWLLIIIVTY